jgi:hypothetical protein
MFFNLRKMSEEVAGGYMKYFGENKGLRFLEF